MPRTPVEEGGRVALLAPDLAQRFHASGETQLVVCEHAIMEPMPQNWANDRIDDLSEEADRIGSDVRELRGEMKDGFKDVQREFTGVQREFTDFRRELTDFRREAKDEFTKVRSEMKAGFDGVNRLIIWGGSGAFFVLLAAIRL